MKVSIITSVFNCENTIKSAIQSVLSQTYKDIEYIVIDGASTDNTMKIVKRYKDRIAIVRSEKDKGIYDGLNRGIKLATGDIIGFLHADDLYENDRVIEKIVDVFKKENADAVYGDLIYVTKGNTNNILRYWRSGRFDPKKLRFGWMPPHPAFFVKRKLYEKHGLYDDTLKISADYDLILRILTHKEYKIFYLPEVIYRMRLGGASNRSFKNILLKSIEDLKVMRRNKVGGTGTLFLKNVTKIRQFLQKNEIEFNERKPIK